jgi:thioredoxin
MASIETISSKEIDTKVCRAPGPVVLDFYQASCAPCRTLEPWLERAAEHYAGRLTAYRVDIDRDLDVAKSFRVTSLPTVLVLRGGEELIRLDGLIKDRDLKAAFDMATST